MANGLRVALRIKKEKGAAVRSVIAPHLGAVLLADEGGRAEGPAQIARRQPTKPAGSPEGGGGGKGTVCGGRLAQAESIAQRQTARTGGSYGTILMPIALEHVNHESGGE